MSTWTPASHFPKPASGLILAPGPYVRHSCHRLSSNISNAFVHYSYADLFYFFVFFSVIRTQMKTEVILKIPNFSISGNPTHFRTLPFNKEPQNEALVHLGLQLLTCVGSPVLTCIRGKLKAGDRPIGSFNCDVTLRALQGSPGSWMSVRMLSNHVCRLPHHPRELSSTFTHSLLGLKLKCDMSALDGLKSCRTKIVGDHYSCDHS